MLILLLLLLLYCLLLFQPLQAAGKQPALVLSVTSLVGAIRVQRVLSVAIHCLFPPHLRRPRSERPGWRIVLIVENFWHQPTSVTRQVTRLHRQKQKQIQNLNAAGRAVTLCTTMIPVHTAANQETQLNLVNVENILWWNIIKTKPKDNKKVAYIPAWVCWNKFTNNHSNVRFYTRNIHWLIDLETSFSATKPLFHQV